MKKAIILLCLFIIVSISIYSQEWSAPEIVREGAGNFELLEDEDGNPFIVWREYSHFYIKRFIDNHWTDAESVLIPDVGADNIYKHSLIYADGMIWCVYSKGIVNGPDGIVDIYLITFPIEGGGCNQPVNMCPENTMRADYPACSYFDDELIITYIRLEETAPFPAPEYSRKYIARKYNGVELSAEYVLSETDEYFLPQYYFKNQIFNFGDFLWANVPGENYARFISGYKYEDGEWDTGWGVGYMAIWFYWYISILDYTIDSDGNTMILYSMNPFLDSPPSWSTKIKQITSLYIPIQYEINEDSWLISALDNYDDTNFLTVYFDHIEHKLGSSLVNREIESTTSEYPIAEYLDDVWDVKLTGLNDNKKLCIWVEKDENNNYSIRYSTFSPPQGINHASGIMKYNEINLKCSPNPFNPSTTISFDLANNGIVSLSIYNIKGQLVRALLNHENMTSGSHTVAWDGRNDNSESCVSGVYYCRFENGKHTNYRKMLLLK